MKITMYHLRTFLEKKGLWKSFVSYVRDKNIPSSLNTRSLYELQKRDPIDWLMNCFCWDFTREGSVVWLSAYHEWVEYCKHYKPKLSTNIKLL